MEKTIIFHHIPKTAGTTMNAIIDEQLGIKEIYTINGWQKKHTESIAQFKSETKETLGKIKLLKGHNTYGLHKWLPQEYSYFTILREPFKRTVSEFNQLLSTPAVLEERVNFLAGNPTLEEYILNGDFEFGFNGQIKRFLQLKNRKEKISRNHFDQAIENLQKDFAIVGLTERFDETIVLLNLKFGWNIKGYVRKNVRKYKKNEHSDRLIQIYREKNKFDILFYEFAKQHFEEILKEYEGEVSKNLHKFNRSNTRFNLRNKFVSPTKKMLSKILKNIKFICW